jgi:hypothetical protein
MGAFRFLGNKNFPGNVATKTREKSQRKWRLFPDFIFVRKKCYFGELSGILRKQSCKTMLLFSSLGIFSNPSKV